MDANITNAIFLNNNCSYEVYTRTPGVVVKDSWFGNNASNYWNKPNINENITIDNWLFLNATADTNVLGIDESSKITFDLYSYQTSGQISKYAGPIDIQLDLTQTLGELDKDAASLGEEVVYTAKELGGAGVNGTFITTTCTIALTNREPTTLYVNGSKTSSGNGTSDEEAFMSLKEALDNTLNGDTIMIASGEYKGTNNTGLTIGKNLTFIKYGDSEAIFNAEDSRRIWYVTALSINITGLTFKNGKAHDGGAIYFENPISNSNINASFINNTADYGGANHFHGSVSTSTVSGTYTNNTAGRSGGANFFYGSISTSTVTGTYTNNNAESGGANIFYSVSGSNITGTYANNTAKYFGGASFQC